ncbi:hexitol phosphatase HxpB [soil metagenome]
MIEAAIYDMDGLLVDSEPWWRVAEANVFGRLSKAPSEADFQLMMGRQIREVIEHWYTIAPWKNYSLEETQKEILSEVTRLVKENGKLLPGVEQSIAFFKNKNLKIALASSSPLFLINELMQHFGLFHRFEIICSAEFEKNGKPHPDVFLKAAATLNIQNENCVVLEDSFNGLLAAKTAGMKCIVVPEKERFNQQRFVSADLKLNSLEELSEENWKLING